MSDKNDKNTLLGAAVFLAGSYAYGSLPFVRSLGLWRGVDLRKAGSGTVGGSNLWQQAGPAAGAIGWFLDASKGALPPVVGRRLGLSKAVRALGATAGVAGQCWPIFSGFDGGRGVSPILGSGAALVPRELAFILPPMVAGCSLRVLSLVEDSESRRGGGWARLRGGRSRAVPLSVGLGILGIPLLSALRGRPSEAVLATAANAALLFFRRATAGEREQGLILIYRLLYDRDTAR